MKKSYTILVSYLLAVVLITMIAIYFLDIPTIISGAPDLVHEYYYKNAIASFVLDTFLIAIYILVAMMISNILKIHKNDYTKRFLITVLSTFIISTIFMLYFKNDKTSDSFFHKWFKKSGMKAVIYDIIFVSCVYLTTIAIHLKYIK